MIFKIDKEIDNLIQEIEKTVKDEILKQILDRLSEKQRKIVSELNFNYLDLESILSKRIDNKKLIYIVNNLDKKENEILDILKNKKFDITSKEKIEIKKIIHKLKEKINTTDYSLEKIEFALKGIIKKSIFKINNQYYIQLIVNIQKEIENKLKKLKREIEDEFTRYEERIKKETEKKSK